VNELLRTTRGGFQQLSLSVSSLRYGGSMRLVAWAILAILMVFIVRRLDAGMDLSDTAFYLISQAWHEQIKAQITLFGPLWDSLSPFRSIYWNRALALTLIVLSSLYLVGGAAAFVTKLPIRQFSPVFPLGVSAALTFYSFWLPDASYDLMNLIFISAALGAFFRLQTILSEKRDARVRKVVLPTAVLGAVGLGIAVVKITTAALLAPAIVICLLYSARRISDRNVWVCSIGAASFGVLVTVCLLATVGLDPYRAMSVLVDGYDVARMITDPHFDVLRSLQIHWSSIQYAVGVNKRLTGLLVLLCILSVTVAINTRIVMAIRPWLRAGQWIVLFAIMIVLARDTTSPQVRLSMIGLLSQVSVIYSLATGEFRGELRVRGVALVAVTLYAQIAYCFGTNSSWSTLASLSTLFALLPAVVLYGSRLGPNILPAVIFVGGAAMLTMGAIERNPYRMDSSFSELTETVTVGPYNEPFKVNLALAPFYRKLGEVRDEFFVHGNMPVLLDLTGRAPMASFQLGARLPGTAWTLSGYPGSTDFFNYFASKLPEQDRQTAWLLVPDDAHPGIPLNLLSSIGMKFPEGYVPVTTVPIPYINAEATLYRPKQSLSLVP